MLRKNQEIIHFHFTDKTAEIVEYTKEYVNSMLNKYKNKPNHEQLKYIEANMSICYRYQEKFNENQKEMCMLFIEFGFIAKKIFSKYHNVDDETSREIFYSIFSIKGK